ncbi:MAG: gamma carbonic anhydrase family protein [Brachymonas sp.]|jgi:carbonic anhydrase/acetyltransferase-like protein (isoleucine patch superfamily)
MSIYRLNHLSPSLAPGVWIAPTASVIGDVHLGEKVSIWFGAVLRGDIERISIAAGSNIQDGSVCHADPGQPLTVGANVTVGHMVMLHGCTIGDNCLIGIGAVVMNGAKIGPNSVVGAGSLVTEGKEFPEGSLIMGSPAKVVRQLDAAALAKLQQNAANYVKNGQRYAIALEEIVAD